MSLPNSSWHRLAIRGPWVPGQAVNFRAAANLLYSIDKDLDENDVDRHFRICALGSELMYDYCFCVSIHPIKNRIYNTEIDGQYSETDALILYLMMHSREKKMYKTEQTCHTIRCIVTPNHQLDDHREFKENNCCSVKYKMK